MSIRINKTCRRTSRIRAGIRNGARVAVVAVGACAMSAPASAVADDANVGVTAEGSVLVATREADASQQPRPIPTSLGADEDILEPISQIAERTPELADLASAEAGDDGDDGNGQGFASALANSAAGDSGAAYRQKLATQPAKFNGIQPGTSTENDVRAAWNEPSGTHSTEDGTVLRYQIEPFQSVEVQIAGDTVSAINIELQGSLPPKRLAKQLSLDTLEAVIVTDAEGVALGQAYPERGVLFMFAPPAEVVAATTNPMQPAVSHVVIQPLDADAFALRAESRLHGPYEQNIQDLNTALSINPNLAHAHWLLAEIYLTTGQAERAEAAAADACDVDPENAAYQLRRAQACNALGATTMRRWASVRCSTAKARRRSSRHRRCTKWRCWRRSATRKSPPRRSPSTTGRSRSRIRWPPAKTSRSAAPPSKC